MNYKSPVYIIAEAGVNHNGSIDMAHQLIDVAAISGANAVKFQTFNAKKLVTNYAAVAGYQKINSPKFENQLDLLKNLELSMEDHRELLNYAVSKKIDFLSTPFDFDSLNFLVNSLGIKKIKISSGDLTNAPFLFAAAVEGDQIILSTGMATLEEIEAALGVLAYGFLNKDASTYPKFTRAGFIDYSRTKLARETLKSRVTLLHCTSEYPAPFDEINLNAMIQMRDYFGLNIGYSDHSTGVSISIAAVALGATTIEKHFTLDRSLVGPDHQASLEPDELNNLVRSVREVEIALGDGIKKPSSSEQKNMVMVRKSLVASSEIKAGELFSSKNITLKRPGNGMDPFLYWKILGQCSSKNYSLDELIDE